MVYDKKVEKLLEGLNQSAIAYDQQRSNNKNSYKYTPNQSKQSYQRYGVPTTTAAKVNGAPFTSNGISDEEKKGRDETELLVFGYGRLLAYQLEDKINQYIDRMKELAAAGRFGGFETLTNNLKHFTKTLDEYQEEGKHVYKG